MKLSEIANETDNQVWHCKNWEVVVDNLIIDELIKQAHLNKSKKARLCLHPKPNEIMQVTYLAFVSPYEDPIHCHPFRPEVLLPVQGLAERRIFSEEGELLQIEIMESGSGNSFVTGKGMWHSLKLISLEFVMLEIGMGPFTADSTHYLKRNIS